MSVYWVLCSVDEFDMYRKEGLIHMPHDVTCKIGDIVMLLLEEDYLLKMEVVQYSDLTKLVKLNRLDSDMLDRGDSVCWKQGPNGTLRGTYYEERAGYRQFSVTIDGMNLIHSNDEFNQFDSVFALFSQAARDLWCYGENK